jgi:hypothetical protein
MFGTPFTTPIATQVRDCVISLSYLYFQLGLADRQTFRRVHMAAHLVASSCVGWPKTSDEQKAAH